MVYEWKNKVVLITGGASGIGAGVVRIIMDEGVKHVAILDIAEAAGKELQKELNTKYGANKVKFFNCDITNDELLLSIFKAVSDEQGYIDVVINNAGIMTDKLNIYKKEIALNVTATVTGTLKAYEMMRKDKGGRGGTVINVSSIAGLHQSPMLPIYYATKSAVLQFSNCIGMNEYYNKSGVRVLVICFGATATPLVQKLGSFDEDAEANFTNSLSVYKFQKPESASQGVVDAYKLGESGSTWLATNDDPVKDISGTVKQAYGLLEATFAY